MRTMSLYKMMLNNLNLSQSSEQTVWFKSLQLSSIVVGALLVYSGLLHALQPFYFMNAIAAYRLSPIWLTATLGLVLPYVQISIGCCIVSNIATRVSLLAASGLFFLYTAVQVIALLHGQDIKCGCYGFTPVQVTPLSAAFPLSLMGICITYLILLPTSATD